MQIDGAASGIEIPQVAVKPMLKPPTIQEVVQQVNSASKVTISAAAMLASKNDVASI